MTNDARQRHKDALDHQIKACRKCDRPDRLMSQA